MMNLLRCAAIANLCLIRIWVDLFGYAKWPPARDYGPPPGSHYQGALLLCAALTGLLWLVFEGVRSMPRLVRMITAGAVCMLILKEIFLTISNVGLFARGPVLPYLSLVVAAVLGAAIYACWKLPYERLSASGIRFSGMLIPLFALTAGSSAINLDEPVAKPQNHYKSICNDKPQQQPHRRLVWILFDELDERVAFAQRPAGFRLPALDRFRAEADTVLLHAHSPFNATERSVTTVMNLPVPGENRVSVFQTAAEKYERVAIAGWAVPYCVLQANVKLAACEWYPLARQHNSYGSPVWFGQARSLLESNHVSPFGQSLTVQHHAEEAEALTATAIKMAADANLDFVYMHLPQTHSPYIWDPATQKASLPARPPDPQGYFRNLQWADQTFAQIRAAMEKSGVWQDSSVLVTADHGFRNATALGYANDDLAVPWMLKGSTVQPVDPAARFETVEGPKLLGLVQED